MTNRRVGSVHRVRLTRLAPQSTSAAAPVLQTHRGEGQGTCTTGRHRPRTACTSGRGTTSAPMDAMRRCRSPVGDRSAADGMVLNGGAAGTGAGNVMNASSRYLVTCCPSPCRDTRAAVVLMSDGPLPRISVGPSRPTGPAPTATHLTGVWRGRATATCRSGHGSVLASGRRSFGALQSPRAGQLFPGWPDHRPQTVPSPRGLRGRRPDPLGLSSGAVRPPESEVKSDG